MLVAEHAEAVRAKPVRLGKSASIEDAFCTILRNCLDQVHANARAGRFRSRSVMRASDAGGTPAFAFGVGLVRQGASRILGLDAELRWIAAELGAARDWGVRRGRSIMPELIAMNKAGADSAELTQMAVANRKRAATAGRVGSRG